MTDSILRSYQFYSQTSIVPFPAAAPFEPEEGSALDLLHDESDGYAINATTYDAFTAAIYVGGPVGGTVGTIDTGTPANNLSEVALDSSNLTNSGTSPKRVHNTDSPYVRWSPHNLCLQSQTFDSGTWAGGANTGTTANATTAPDGTSTADLLYASSSGNGVFKQQQCTTAQTVHTASVYAKVNSWTWMAFSLFDAAHNYVYFNVASGSIGTTDSDTTATITSVGSGWYRCTVTIAAPASTNLYITLNAVDADGSLNATASGTNGIYLWGGQMNRGYIATPHLVTTTTARIGIPQSYDTVAAQYGILVEPTATNLVKRSEELNHSDWSTQGIASVTADNIAAPDGSTTAERITEDGINSRKSVYQAMTIASTTVVTMSAYFKAGTNSYVTLGYNDGGSSPIAVFDLTGGTAASQTFGSPTSTNQIAIGDGWYRCAMTFTVGTLNKEAMFGPAGAATGNSLSDGAATFLGTSRTFYAWGYQFETGTVASSYVPTIGSTATRAVDVPLVLESSFPGSDTNNTIYLDYKPLDVSSGTRYGWAYWKDSNNFYSLAGVTANPTMGNTNAGTPQFAVDLGTLVANTRTQITVAAKANDFDGSQDGAAPTAQGTATLTTGYTTLYLGTFGTTGSELNGYIYRMVQVPYQRETVNSDLETWRYNF